MIAGIRVLRLSAESCRAKKRSNSRLGHRDGLQVSSLFLLVRRLVAECDSHRLYKGGHSHSLDPAAVRLAVAGHAFRNRDVGRFVAGSLGQVRFVADRRQCNSVGLYSGNG